MVYDRFIVIKDFYKIGSIVYRGSTSSDLVKFSEAFRIFSKLAQSPVQVVELGGIGALETYSEYSPYVFEDDIDKIASMILKKDIPGKLIDEVIREAANGHD